jgi:hypothetical protein
MLLVTGSEIFEAQILDQTSETSRFLLPGISHEATSIKTDQTQARRDAAIPAGSQVMHIH